MRLERVRGSVMAWPQDPGGPRPFRRRWPVARRGSATPGLCRRLTADGRIASWGAFTDLQAIGQGTFAVVYRAHDARLRRDVALKLLRRTDAAGAGVFDEARALARIDHSSVVRVHGADVVGGVAGIWTELIDGRTLDADLSERGPLGFREVATIGLALCAALQAVHAAGVVHGDVKPQNVMRTTSGRLVLLDFGASQIVGAPSARRIGTPLYMAPDVLGGGLASPASDLYALGVLLFRLVTGTFPVVASDERRLEAALAAGARRRLGSVRPGLPPAFVDAVERASALDPTGRFADLSELAGRLSELGAPTRSA